MYILKQQPIQNTILLHNLRILFVPSGFDIALPNIQNILWNLFH
jgi:hypothetical protein